MSTLSENRRTVILVTNDGMGKSDPELQHILAAKYFQMLLEDGKLPAAICFYTTLSRILLAWRTPRRISAGVYHRPVGHYGQSGSIPRHSGHSDACRWNNSADGENGIPAGEFQLRHN